jgi:hypothetical protein
MTYYELPVTKGNAMTQYETCRHAKEDGAYCGSPSLRERKYCYYHLMQRARRLRRARALRDNVTYRLEIQSLDNPYAIRDAVSDVAQALAAGQLDARVAGKLLYAFQLASSANRRIEKMEAAQLEQRKETKDGVPQVRARLLGDNLGSDAADSRIHEFPDFEKQLGLPPDVDLDDVIAAVEQKADEEAKYRKEEALPEPPPGVRAGSPAYRLFREEGYQVLRAQVTRMKFELREYNEQKRQQYEAEMKKEMMSAAPAPQTLADTA